MSTHETIQIKQITKQIKEHSKIYQEIASNYGISNTEFWVLYALLVFENELTQQDICDLWSFPKQTINSVISNLMKKGYVNLEFIPGSKNKKIINLTTSGKNYCKKYISPIYEAEKRVLSKFTNKEIDEYSKITTKLLKLLKEEFNLKDMF